MKKLLILLLPIALFLSCEDSEDLSNLCIVMNNSENQCTRCWSTQAEKDAWVLNCQPVQGELTCKILFEECN